MTDAEVTAVAAKRKRRALIIVLLLSAAAIYLDKSMRRELLKLLNVEHLST